MSNSESENLLVVDAFKQIAAKYGNLFHHSPENQKFMMALMSGKAENISAVVRFEEEDAFGRNLNLFQIARARTGCEITAFTAKTILSHYDGSMKNTVTTKFDREIFVNRGRASRAVVVHELLHFLTHPRFYGYVAPRLAEAVTEYFTRRILGGSATISGYNAYYDSLIVAKKQFKPHLSTGQGGPGKGYLKRAYFAGDTDALSVLQSHRTFDELRELLNAVDS